MKLRTAVMLAPVLFALVLRAPSARAADDLEAQLKTAYLGKVLTLRHFYSGHRLRFNWDGAPIGIAKPGPWTTDGQISITKIELRGRTLELTGRRVCLVFDAKAKPYRDVLDFLSESKAEDRGKSEKFFENRDVEIKITLPSENTNKKEAAATMNAIFLAHGESMRGMVPTFWRDYFDRQEGREISAPAVAGTVYEVKEDEVSAPRVILQPDPVLTEEAHRARYAGTTTLTVVVGVAGDVSDPQIQSPLGLGLDENAVETVKTWKFNPGRKDGKPVAVKTTVAVEFHQQ
jgi:TonB family protein